MFKKSIVQASYTNARISPKKVAPVMDLVRGMSLHQAKLSLAFQPSKAGQLILKVLRSAEANARNNFKLDASRLFVSELWVSGGKVAKWGQPVARGRFNPLLKRSSHIYVGLNEKSNGGSN